LVAQGAVIEGDLHTQEAVIAGQVSGAIHARERVELQATAMVAGDILTPRISIIEGARVTGEVKMDAAARAEPSGIPHNS
jgi:cytoskeletal protein CcmA (bactofilin family)